MISPSRRRRIAGCIVGLCGIVWSQVAGAYDESEGDVRTSRHTIELSLHTGMARMLLPSPNRLQERSHTNGGLAFALGVTYRSPYIVSPFAEFGYTPLYENAVSTGSTSNFARSTLSAWSGTLGVALGLGRIRLQAGIGVFDLIVRSAVKEGSMTATELDMGYVLGARATFYESPPIRLGFDFRLGLITDAATAYATLGLCVSFDIYASPITESSLSP